tara:strand:- start:5645 stop:15472 length:9828 start_codon:yes stop_codon:yes gene_type:complete
MDEEALKYAFELFKKDGYNGSIEEYKGLINKDEKAFEYSYDLFKKDGYNGKSNEFKTLIGLTDASQTNQPTQETTDPLKKKVSTNTTSVSELSELGSSQQKEVGVSEQPTSNNQPAPTEQKVQGKSTPLDFNPIEFGEGFVEDNVAKQYNDLLANTSEQTKNNYLNFISLRDLTQQDQVAIDQKEKSLSVEITPENKRKELGLLETIAQDFKSFSFSKMFGGDENFKKEQEKQATRINEERKDRVDSGSLYNDITAKKQKEFLENLNNPEERKKVEQLVQLEQQFNQNIIFKANSSVEKATKDIDAIDTNIESLSKGLEVINKEVENNPNISQEEYQSKLAEFENKSSLLQQEIDSRNNIATQAKSELDQALQSEAAIGSFEEEKNLLKKSYAIDIQTSEKLKTGFAQLFSNLEFQRERLHVAAGSYGFGQQERSDALDKVTKEALERTQVIEKYRENTILEGVSGSDIESFSDAGEFAFNAFVDTSPTLLQMAVPYVGVASFVASQQANTELAFRQRTLDNVEELEEVNKALNNSDTEISKIPQLNKRKAQLESIKKPSETEIFLTSTSLAVAEALLGKIGKIRLLNKLKRVALTATKQELRLSVQKSLFTRVRKGAFEFTKDTSGEVLEESGIQLANNIVDIYVLGEKFNQDGTEKNLLDGTYEAGLGGLAVGGGLSGATTLIGTVGREIADKKSRSTIVANVKESNELLANIDAISKSTLRSAEEKSIIIKGYEKRLAEINQQNFSIINKNIDSYNNLTPIGRRRVAQISNEASAIEFTLTKIQNQKELDETDKKAVASLKERLTNLDAEKQDLLVSAEVKTTIRSVDGETVLNDNNSLYEKIADDDFIESVAIGEIEIDIKNNQEAADLLTQRVNEFKEEQKAPALRTAEAISENIEDLGDVMGGGAVSITEGGSKLVLTQKGDNIKVESISTPKGQRGKGSARALMTKLTDEADNQGKAVELNVVPLTEDTNAEQLVTFYESLGFVKEEDFNLEGGLMIRQPQENTTTEVAQETTPQQSAIDRVAETNDTYFDELENEEEALSRLESQIDPNKDRNSEIERIAEEHTNSYLEYLEENGESDKLSDTNFVQSFKQEAIKSLSNTTENNIDVIGKQYEYVNPITNETLIGEIFFDGEEVVFTDGENEFSLGFKNDINEEGELGATEVKPVFEITKDGKINYNGDSFDKGEVILQEGGVRSIKTDKNGNVKRVVVTDSKGNTRSLRGEEANQLAELILLEKTLNGELERKLDTDANAKQIIEQGVDRATKEVAESKTNRNTKKPLPKRNNRKGNRIAELGSRVDENGNPITEEEFLLEQEKVNPNEINDEAAPTADTKPNADVRPATEPSQQQGQDNAVQPTVEPTGNTAEVTQKPIVRQSFGNEVLDVELKNGEVVVTNSFNKDKKVSRKNKKAAVKEYIAQNTFDNQQYTETESSDPSVNSRQISDESTNPSEVALQIQVQEQAEKDGTVSTDQVSNEAKQNAIAETFKNFRFKKVDLADGTKGYEVVDLSQGYKGGQKQTATMGTIIEEAQRALDSNTSQETDAMSVQATSFDGSDRVVSEDDIRDFVNDFTSGTDYLNQVKKEQTTESSEVQSLKEKFTELTGLEATADNINAVSNTQQEQTQQATQEDVSEDIEDDGLPFQTNDPNRIDADQTLSKEELTEQIQQLIPTGLAEDVVVLDSDGINAKAAEIGLENVQSQVIGENAELSSEILTNLEIAKNLTEEGKSAQEIKNITSWELGVDGKWKYETPSDFKITENIEYGKATTLGELSPNNVLFTFYPQLREVKVTLNKGNDSLIGRIIPEKKGSGYYFSRLKEIGASANKRSNLESTLNHEIQHAIQDIEGFAVGGNKNKDYKKLAGEVEARNVQNRNNLTEEQRRGTLLSQTQDVDSESQVILFRKKEDEVRYQKNASSKGVTMTPNGFVYKGVVYINSDKVKADTAVHEFGHLWNSYMKENHKEVFDRGIKLMEDSQYLADVENNEAYDHLSPEGKLEEALAQAIGDKGAKILEENKKKSFANWFNVLFKRIANGLRLSNIQPTRLANLNLKQFTDLAAAEILAGKNITGRDTKAIKDARKRKDVVPNTSIQSVIQKEEAVNAAKQKVVDTYESKQKTEDGVKKALQDYIDESLSAAQATEAKKLELKRLVDIVANAKTDTNYLRAIEKIDSIIDKLDDKYNTSKTEAQKSRKEALKAARDSKTDAKKRKKVIQDYLSKVVDNKFLSDINFNDIKSIQNLIDNSTNENMSETISKIDDLAVKLETKYNERTARNDQKRREAQEKIRDKKTDIKEVQKIVLAYINDAIDNNFMGNATPAETKRLIRKAKFEGRKTGTDVEKRAALQKVLDQVVEIDLGVRNKGLRRDIKSIIDKPKNYLAKLNGKNKAKTIDNSTRKVILTIKDNYKKSVEDIQREINSLGADLAETDIDTFVGLNTALEIAKARETELAYKETKSLELLTSTVLQNTDIVDTLEDLLSQGRSRLTEQVRTEAQRLLEITNEAKEDTKTAKSNRTKIEIQKEQFEKKNNFFNRLSQKFGGVSNINLAKTSTFSFEYLMGYIDRVASQGEGRLYKRFYSGENGLLQKDNNFKADTRKLQQSIKSSIEGLLGKKFNNIYSNFMQSKELNKVRKTNIVLNEDAELGQGTLPLSYNQGLYIHLIFKMDAQNEQLRKQGWDDTSFKQLEDFLGKEYLGVSDYVTKLLEDQYSKYNQTHLELLRTDLGFEEGYFPTKYDDVDLAYEIDLSGAKFSLASVMPSNIKEKVKNNNRIDISQNAFDVLNQYLDSMERFHHYGRFTKDLNAVINNKDFKNNVKSYDERAYSDLLKLSKAIVGDKSDFETGKLEQGLYNLNSTVASGYILFKGWTALKQFLSMPAYTEFADMLQVGNYKIPVVNKILFGLKMGANLNPISIVRNHRFFLKNSVAYAERQKRGDIGDEFVKELLNSGTRPSFIKKAFKNFAAIGISPNKLVDAITISSGGRTYYNQQYKKYKKSGLADKKAKEQAIRDMEVGFLTTQQSSDVGNLSAVQIRKGALTALFLPFKNAQLGYFRRINANKNNVFRRFSNEKQRLIDNGSTNAKANTKAFINTVNKAETIEDVSNILLYTHVLPLIWQYVASGLPGLLTEWDDEDTEEIKRAAYLGAIDGLFIVNDLAHYSYNKLVLKKQWGFNEAIILSEIETTTTEIYKASKETGFMNKDVLLEIGKAYLKTKSIQTATFENIYEGSEKAIIEEGYLSEDIFKILNAPKVFQKKDDNNGKVTRGLKSTRANRPTRRTER